MLVENKSLISDKAIRLEKLYTQFRKLKQHPFADFSKTKIVMGEGNINSQLLFLGEGPGREEDALGLPFVGRAGQLLTKMINAMGFDREEIFITNVIKCRLPNNRPPTFEEIQQEKALILDQELAILAPKIICCLGSSASQAIFNAPVKMSQIRGKLSSVGIFDIMPTYHPAYLLRNPEAKKVVWLDLQGIMEYLKCSL